MLNSATFLQYCLFLSTMQVIENSVGFIFFLPNLHKALQTQIGCEEIRVAWFCIWWLNLFAVVCLFVFTLLIYLIFKM